MRADGGAGGGGGGGDGNTKITTCADNLVGTA